MAFESPRFRERRAFLGQKQSPVHGDRRRLSRTFARIRSSAEDIAFSRVPYESILYGSIFGIVSLRKLCKDAERDRFPFSNGKAEL